MIPGCLRPWVTFFDTAESYGPYTNEALAQILRYANLAQRKSCAMQILRSANSAPHRNFISGRLIRCGRPDPPGEGQGSVRLPKTASLLFRPSLTKYHRRRRAPIAFPPPFGQHGPEAACPRLTQRRPIRLAACEPFWPNQAMAVVAPFL